MELLRTIRRLYPLTTAGTVLFLLSFYFLGIVWYAANIYALVFSLLGLLFLLMLLILGFSQAARFRDLQFSWDPTRSLFTRLPGMKHVFHTGNNRPFYFFRFHLVLKGRLKAGRDASFSYVKEGSASQGGEIHIPTFFPVCGQLDVHASLYIRDVFGFVRFSLGEPVHRGLVVRPPVFPGSPPRQFQEMVSEESNKRMQISDDEKFYMREYVAGDRMKDINWKASVRVENLITRVSTSSPEQSHLVHVEFRNFSSAEKDDPRAILHLNYMKSWLITFLRSVKKKYPNFRFQVITGMMTETLETDDELDRFEVWLSTVNYIKESSAYEEPATGHGMERFIFSTPYDQGLNDYLGRNSLVRSNILRTVENKKNKKFQAISFLKPASLDLLPGFWFFRRNKVPEIHPPVSQGELHQANLKISLL